MFQKRDYIVLIFISIILGILLVRQLYTTKQTEKLKTAEETQLTALEISRLLKANADLRLEMKELAATSEKYQKSLEDRKSASEELAKNLEKYQILSGRTKIKGPGLEIIIEGDFDKEQAVDLINALRNIGIEGLSINGRRFIISSYIKANEEGLFINDAKLTKPYRLMVVGNAPLIKEALERKGGIIEQIKADSQGIKVRIEKKEPVVLEAV